ncbi:MAG: hypothetical protein HY925_00305 [Elusimicrobia bacterium]|nr:hypothetical protein [Elusimicrobiota bacterium]
MKTILWTLLTVSILSTGAEAAEGCPPRVAGAARLKPEAIIVERRTANGWSQDVREGDEVRVRVILRNVDNRSASADEVSAYVPPPVGVTCPTRSLTSIGLPGYSSPDDRTFSLSRAPSTLRPGETVELVGNGRLDMIFPDHPWEIETAAGIVRQVPGAGRNSGETTPLDRTWRRDIGTPAVELHVQSGSPNAELSFGYSSRNADKVQAQVCKSEGVCANAARACPAWGKTPWSGLPSYEGTWTPGAQGGNCCFVYRARACNGTSCSAWTYKRACFGRVPEF